MKSRVAAVGAILVLIIAIVVAVLMHTPPFTVSGDLSAPLKPGVSAPLDLTINNPHSYPITVTSVAVSVDAVKDPMTGKLSRCAVRNFSVAQLAHVTPLVLAPNTHATLASLHVPKSYWPRVHMVKSTELQNACKSVGLQLGFHADGNFWDNIWNQLAGKK